MESNNMYTSYDYLMHFCHAENNPKDLIKHMRIYQTKQNVLENYHQVPLLTTQRRSAQCGIETRASVRPISDLTL